MTEREREILDDVALKLRARKLWRDYGIDWWHLNEYPAPVLDDLLHLDHIESVVMDEQSRSPG
jgi:hypothetical protein